MLLDSLININWKLITLMKKKGKLFATTLLLVCILSMTFTTLLVQAGNLGNKVLNIQIDGQGSVNVTNDKQNLVDSVTSPGGVLAVGAGIVNLEAVAAEGYEFVDWSGTFLNDDVNPVDFKAVKYATIIATFKLKTYTITPSVEGAGSIDPIVPQTVDHGADQEFTFAPAGGYHISAIVVDGVYLSSFVTNYTFEDVTANHTIEVIFDADGIATVPVGTDVTVFPDPSVSLTLSTNDGGTAIGNELLYIAGVTAWEISIDFTTTGEVLVTLKYDGTDIDEADEELLFLVRADSMEALRSDLNGDFIVNGDDVSDLANLIKWKIYEEVYDLVPDGVLDELDKAVVISNMGAILEQIVPEIDTVNDIMTFTTDSFSIWGVRGAFR